VEILEAPMKTPKGKFRLLCFDSGEEHPPVAIVYGEIAKDKPPLVRIQSECLTGHVFNSLTCDCSGQRTDSIDKIVAEGSGILIHLWQEGREQGSRLCRPDDAGRGHRRRERHHRPQDR
jgi:GTP cyclohydrolase II